MAPLTTNEPKLGQNAIRFTITKSLALTWKDRLGSVFAVSASSGKPLFLIKFTISLKSQTGGCMSRESISIVRSDVALVRVKLPMAALLLLISDRKYCCRKRKESSIQSIGPSFQLFKSLISQLKPSDWLVVITLKSSAFICF